MSYMRYTDAGRSEHQEAMNPEKLQLPCIFAVRTDRTIDRGAVMALLTLRSGETTGCEAHFPFVCASAGGKARFHYDNVSEASGVRAS